MFGLLGVRSRQRAHELAGELSQFYADDQRMIELIDTMLQLAQRALRDVARQLGPRGFAVDHFVESAARMLGIYASAFDEPEHELAQPVDELDTAARALIPAKRRCLSASATAR